jgi:hypothetical protein
LYDITVGLTLSQVWPRSHVRVFGLVGDAYNEETRKIRQDTAPVISSGKAGDCILWHHRTQHAPSANIGTQLRQAFLYDFYTRPSAELESIHAGLEPTERRDGMGHPMYNSKRKETYQADASEMWRGWSESVVCAAANVEWSAPRL